jgi:SAM-dependent methyltransferase
MTDQTCASPQFNAEEIPMMDVNEIKAMLACLKLYPAPITALEWGSGNSTLYFSSFLQAGSHWHALEHNQEWSLLVQQRLHNTGRQDISLHSIPNNTPFNDGVDDGDFSSFYDYVLHPLDLGTKFDFILVDGRARVDCMRLGWKLLKDDGIMVLHDAQRQEYQHGVPNNCSFVKIRNPLLQNEGNIAVYFMSRHAGRMKDLHTILNNLLPSHMVIETCFNETSQSQLLPPRVTPQTLTSEAASTPVYHEKTCLFVNTYYPGFVNSHYASHTGLSEQSYDAQIASIQAEFFGDSDFYSRGMKAAGWLATDVIANCEPLQNAWARENDFIGTGLNILVEQIKRMKPAVVYLQDLNLATSDFMHAIKPLTGIIVGQIASPVPPTASLSELDIIVSSFPHFVERFREAGIKAYYQPLSFEPRILDVLQKLDYEYPVTFVGGISPAHGSGLDLLEYLVDRTPIEFWGYGADTLPDNSKIKARHHGEVWAHSMFNVFHNSYITVNRHIDVAENNANNMRLFEATGCGALLITDYKDNLNELFVIGEEIVAYRSPEECVALVKYYLEHPEEGRRIAEAGQRRTLTEHCYALRLQDTVNFLERHFLNSRVESELPAADYAHISYDMKDITATDTQDSDWEAWKSDEIPLKQRALVQTELQSMYRGDVPTVFDILANAIKPYMHESRQLLEIGCASGYYAEVLEYLLSTKLDYTGVDYSEALISMARDFYPEKEFQVADGANLPYADNSFHFVISSCVLLHVGNYKDHIYETIRVAEKYVIAHRTPVCRQSDTRYIRKKAYGVETVELVFNEFELLNTFLTSGMKIVGAYEYGTDVSNDKYEITYVFEKVSS